MQWNEKIEKIMSSPPLTIQPYDRLSNAAKMMYQGSVGSIIVVDEKYRPIGILTKSDFLYFVASGIVKRDPLIKEVMKAEPVVANIEETIEIAYERMKSLGIRHLPVVDREGVLKGVLSMRDILLYVCKPLKNLNH